jgi:hypothetical protein
MTSPWRELTIVAVTWLAVYAPIAPIVVGAVKTHRTELRDPAYARAVLRQTRALSQQQVEWFVGEQRQAATE